MIPTALLPRMGASVKETVSSRFVGPESKLITGEDMLKAKELISPAKQ